MKIKSRTAASILYLDTMSYDKAFEALHDYYGMSYEGDHSDEVEIMADGPCDSGECGICAMTAEFDDDDCCEDPACDYEGDCCEMEEPKREMRINYFDPTDLCEAPKAENFQLPEGFKVWQVYQDIYPIEDLKTELEELRYDVEHREDLHSSYLKGLTYAFSNMPVKSEVKLQTRYDAPTEEPTIYKVPKSAERRIFYIDVGNMPEEKKKVQEYIDEVKRDMHAFKWTNS